MQCWHTRIYSKKAKSMLHNVQCSQRALPTLIFSDLGWVACSTSFPRIPTAIRCQSSRLSGSCQLQQHLDTADNTHYVAFPSTVESIEASWRFSQYKQNKRQKTKQQQQQKTLVRWTDQQFHTAKPIVACHKIGSVTVVRYFLSFLLSFNCLNQLLSVRVNKITVNMLTPVSVHSNVCTCLIVCMFSVLVQAFLLDVCNVHAIFRNKISLLWVWCISKMGWLSSLQKAMDHSSMSRSAR